MQLKTLNGDVAKAVDRGEAPGRSLSDLLVRDAPVAYAFIAPAFFLLLFLVAYPFALSVWLSLSDARIGRPGHSSASRISSGSSTARSFCRRFRILSSSQRQR